VEMTHPVISMTLVVFLRGINVGGHRRLRPSDVARELAAYDVVNVGAAGTLVVRRPGSTVRFLAELRRKLPFEAKIVFCSGEDLLRLEMEDPFRSVRSGPDTVQFVSFLSKENCREVSLPIVIPETGEWFVRIIGSQKHILYGEYRRHMKTISYLGQIDELAGSSATTRSWSTILSVLRVLKADTLSAKPRQRGREAHR
jgi:uncharacterized protein (DUF1697 family)